jgi:hypothetical protein
MAQVENGGAGGGGKGGRYTVAGADSGTINTGSGGGGAYGSAGELCGLGGSGVVIVRYLTSDASGYTITGGTKVVGPTGATAYTVHTFNSSGSLVIA